jgi:hypothetical protein
MGNRKRLKDNSLRLKKDPNVLQRGIAKIVGQPSGYRPPTHDEAVANPDLIAGLGLIPEDLASRESITNEALLGMGFKPDDLASPEVVIKVVPAKHKGVTVGDAYIHEDAQVTIKFHEDAPKWALDEIRGVADKIGYSLEAGEHSGPS